MLPPVTYSTPHALSAKVLPPRAELRFSIMAIQADAQDAIRSSADLGMVWIPGGTFRMGSDNHYPEEAPAHRVTVDAFWIDRAPVTNRQFKEFVRATGHITYAELPPDPERYPGALPHLLDAGSLVFQPPSHPVDLRYWGEWWCLMKGAGWRHPYGPKSNINALDNHPVVHVTFADDRSGVGVRCARWAGRFRVRLGRRVHTRRQASRQHLARRVSTPKSEYRRLRTYLAGKGVSSKRLRPA